MTYYAKSLNCCGIGEISGMNGQGPFDPEVLIKWIMDKFNYAKLANAANPQRKEAGRGAFLLTIAYGRGFNLLSKRETTTRTNRLRKYIEKNGLGNLIVAPDVGNPNYQNNHFIRTLLFLPNQEAMLQFCKAQKWAVPNTYQHNYWINGA